MDSPSVARPDARDAKTQRHAELQALLGRVEAATGADRELDALIGCTFPRVDLIEGNSLVAKEWEGGFWATVERDPSGAIVAYHQYRPFTASLDAVLALAERALPDSHVVISSVGAPWSAWEAELSTGYDEKTGDATICVVGWSPSGGPALALLAALLKALLSSEEQPSVCEQREQAAPATAEQLLNTSEADEKR